MDKPPVQRRGEDPPVRPGLGRGGHDGSLGGMGLVEVEDNGRGLEHHQGEHPRGCESCKRGVAGPATVLADGRIQLCAPKRWVRIQPEFMMEYFEHQNTPATYSHVILCG
jgi:hypothetical protein